MGKTWGWIGIALLVVGIGVGCGGAGKSYRQAQADFARAQEAGAETKAAYEYYAAEAYLQLAEHEFDEVDLKQTALYAEKSIDFSRQALEKAGGGAQ